MTRLNPHNYLNDSDPIDSTALTTHRTTGREVKLFKPLTFNLKINEW